MAKPTKGRILTVRISAPLERRLRGRAKETGTSPSEVVRSILEHELGEEVSGRELLARARSLIGSLSDPNVPAGRDAKAALAKWRPDRSG